jgi:SAM-dependent methyltransferase
MDTKTIYSSKAEKYARYRWDYAPAAVDALARISGLSMQAVVADLGAGSGILTRHLARRAGQVYAVEPNFELRKILVREMQSFSRVTVLDACAEATGLPDQSVDIITVAQAIHWFDPEPARAELRRILKAGGWLALLRNYGTDRQQNEATAALMSPEYGANPALAGGQPQRQPPRFYFGHDHFERMAFPFQFRQNWEEFLGALTSASFMPDEGHPLFDRLAARAREVFDGYSQAGVWLVSGETELLIGQPA